MIYVPTFKSENLQNPIGIRWQINNTLIAKIDCMFLITDLQIAINLDLTLSS